MKYYAIFEQSNEEQPLIGILSLDGLELAQRKSFDLRLQSVLEDHFDADVEYTLGPIFNWPKGYIDLEIEVERDGNDYYCESIRIIETQLY